MTERLTPMGRPSPGERVSDGKGHTGRLLRYETYPGTGGKVWATVKFDHKFAADRAEVGDLERTYD